MSRVRLTPAWSWVVLGAVLRLSFSLKLGDRFHQIDEIGYDTVAWQWASTGVIGSHGQPGVAPPIPALFFGLPYLLGHHMLYARVVEAFLGAALVWLIGRMTEELTGSRPAGRVALMLSAVYPFFIYYSGMVMSETLYMAAAVPGLWLLCRSLAERGARPGTAAASGFLLALAALSRPEGAPIALLIWLAAAWACLKGRFGPRAWTLAVLFWALPLGLWCARNKALTGRFSPDNHGGMALLHGSVLFDLNEKDTGLAMAELNKMPFYQEAQRLPESARDAVYTREALRSMREHPVRTLGQSARKLVNFWRLYPRLDKEYHESVYSHPSLGLGRWFLVAISLIWEPALILGGFWGLWLLRGRSAELFPLGLFLLGTMAIHAVSVSQMRYRLPVMPILIFGAASLVARLKPD